MVDKKQKEILISTFDAVAGDYDCRALKFFVEASGHLAGMLDLSGGEQVLDVATGTGNAALTIAEKLSDGRVTAIDFSPGMLGQARHKAELAGLRNVEFREMDMQELQLPESFFDVAVCAFGIFFVQDMETLLSQIAATVKPGGRIAITGFHERHFFQPLSDLLFRRMEKYQKTPEPPQAWKRIANPGGCIQLFQQAGLGEIKVVQESLGYFLEDADEWWDVVWNAGFRRLVSQLSPSELECFRSEHLREVEALSTPEGIWMDVGVLFTTGVKKLRHEH